MLYYYLLLLLWAWWCYHMEMVSLLLASQVAVDMRCHSTHVMPLPDSKVHRAYMGPTWGRQDPGGPHVGPMNLAFRAVMKSSLLLIHLTHWDRDKMTFFTDHIFKCIFLNKNVWILLTISMKCVPKMQINNIPALVQMMAWHRPGDKPLSEPMMVKNHMYVCHSPQWVKVSTFLTEPLIAYFGTISHAVNLMHHSECWSS